MEDNSTIDLKKLRRNLPPPPIPVPPLDPAAAPRPIAMPPPQAEPRKFAAPPTPAMMYRKRSGIGSMLPRLQIPSGRTLAIGAVVIAVLFGGYYIYVNFWTKSPFGPTGADAKAEAASIAATSTDNLSEADIIAAVGKVMLLPSDETPTLAKVSDPAVLQSQAFFKNAVVGDVVLMYPKSLRAILFDPTQGKIIEVGPITAAASTSTATSTHS